MLGVLVQKGGLAHPGIAEGKKLNQVIIVHCAHITFIFIPPIKVDPRKVKLLITSLWNRSNYISLEIWKTMLCSMYLMYNLTNTTNTTIKVIHFHFPMWDCCSSCPHHLLQTRTCAPPPPAQHSWCCLPDEQYWSSSNFDELFVNRSNNFSDVRIEWGERVTP